eukprot:105522-Amphidinium_carterae.1
MAIPQLLSISVSCFLYTSCDCYNECGFALPPLREHLGWQERLNVNMPPYQDHSSDCSCRFLVIAILIKSCSCLLQDQLGAVLDDVYGCQSSVLLVNNWVLCLLQTRKSFGVGAFRLSDFSGAFSFAGTLLEARL